MNTLAIDPGVSGGFAFNHNDGLRVWKYKSDADTIERIKLLNTTFTIHNAILEKVHSSPQMGVRSAFTFGENFGLWRGLLETLSIPVRLVPPQEWQRMYPELRGIQGQERKRAIVTGKRRAYTHLGR